MSIATRVLIKSEQKPDLRVEAAVINMHAKKIYPFFHPGNQSKTAILTKFT